MSIYDVRRNKRKFYLYMLIVGFVLWIGETAFFGFNRTPQSGLEATLDAASVVLMLAGFIGDVLQNLTIVKHYEVSGDYNSIDRREINANFVKIDATKATINKIDGPALEAAADRVSIERNS